MDILSATNGYVEGVLLPCPNLVIVAPKNVIELMSSNTLLED